MAVSFSEAIKAKYVTACEEADVVVGGKKVELVGMKRMQFTLEDCKKLRSVSLREEGVSCADQGIKDLCPNVTELDLSCCRFGSWQVVTDICCQLSQLSSLDLSCNLLEIAVPPPLNANSSFQQLRRLVLNKTKVQWPQIESLAPYLPELQELNLETNDITSLSRQRPSAPLFPNLQSVNLTQNALSSWLDLAPLETLPCLLTLVLNDNQLDIILKPADAYPALTSLSIANNPIKEISSIDAVNCFPGPIQSLRVSPLVEGLTLVQSRMMVLPRLPKLLIFNNSKITPKERTDAQRLYLQACAQELRTQWNVEQHCDDCSDIPEDFRLKHPLYPDLVGTIFNPLPIISEGCAAKQAAGSGQTISLILRSMVAASMTKGDKPKRFPPSFPIGKLKLACQTAYGLPMEKQRLVARINSGDGIPYACDLDDDFKDLQFYCLMDDTVIEMHERDLEEEKRLAAARKAQEEERLQKQLKQRDGLVEHMLAQGS